MAAPVAEDRINAGGHTRAILTIKGQKILTADKVAIRVTLHRFTEGNALVRWPTGAMLEEALEVCRNT